MTVPAEVESAFAAVEADLGAVTLAVACAGTGGPLGPLHLADPEAWWRAVEVDLRGSMLTARSAVGRMVGSRAGRFVMVYGNLGDRLGAHVSAFAAAKAGVARLTEVLAGEVEDSGVRVFGLHPGFVRTALTERLAWGVEGQAWLPRFGVGVEDRWGDGRPAAELVEAIALGARRRPVRPHPACRGRPGRAGRALSGRSGPAPAATAPGSAGRQLTDGSDPGGATEGTIMPRSGSTGHACVLAAHLPGSMNAGPAARAGSRFG